MGRAATERAAMEHAAMERGAMERGAMERGAMERAARRGARARPRGAGRPQPLRNAIRMIVLPRRTSSTSAG